MNRTLPRSLPWASAGRPLVITIFFNPQKRVLRARKADQSAHRFRKCLPFMRPLSHRALPAFHMHFGGEYEIYFFGGSAGFSGTSRRRLAAPAERCEHLQEHAARLRRNVAHRAQNARGGFPPMPREIAERLRIRGAKELVERVDEDAPLLVGTCVEPGVNGAVCEAAGTVDARTGEKARPAHLP